MPPFAEYLMLHLYLLSGSDHLLNLVQWLSFVGSLICVSLIARMLGVSPRGQILAAVFCATIPNGITQASGAKNEYLIAFLLAASVYFLLSYTEYQHSADLLLSGAALGLALLT